MVDRKEVEALLLDIEEVEALLLDIDLTADEHKCQPADATFEIEGDTLAALCRAWLAVQEAPVGEYEYIVSDVAYIHFDNEGDAPNWSGDRVRIVKEVGDE